ncbi:tail fiber assembly protein [Ketogulonicigenium vulgare]|uniref:tail fiber assembly protein n=1 Tax=Ketogulonicigenium vulgare TaxID=92945 RepID=UPI002358B04E|nr:tail fiber assembly protein [Ketogulonicigenium vulgare]
MSVVNIKIIEDGEVINTIVIQESQISNFLQEGQTYEVIGQAPASFDGLRAERDRRLAESDKYVLPDYPISESQRNAWLAYRVSLRELPELTTDPLNPSWPEPPTN